ncbi:hypothetical protein ACOMHN_030369 [Nucella lapillus]
MFGINVDPSKAQSGPWKKPGGAGGKPDLRNPLMRLFKFKLVKAALVVFTTTVAFRVGVVNRRRNMYREFYETYDPSADFERMKKAGVFTSVKPDGSVGGL